MNNNELSREELLEIIRVLLKNKEKQVTSQECGCSQLQIQPEFINDSSNNRKIHDAVKQYRNAITNNWNIPVAMPEFFMPNVTNGERSSKDTEGSLECIVKKYIFLGSLSNKHYIMLSDLARLWNINFEVLATVFQSMTGVTKKTVAVTLDVYRELRDYLWKSISDDAYLTELDNILIEYLK